MLQTPTTRSTKLARSNNSHGASMTTTLPDDILVEIFSRLPARSVRRFRCLSRSWAATLTSAPFVGLHLHQANYQLVPKLFFRNWPDQILTKPCHGLVLLHRHTHGGHYVYNPSTSELLHLPDSAECRQRRGVSFGLGYCPATMEHKVVRVFFSYHDTPCCEVFTLNVSAHWRAVAEKPPSCTVRRSPVVFCDGYLHFLHELGVTRIFTFDISAETFGSLTVPPAAQDVDGPLELTVLDGRLCLCVFSDRRPRSNVDPYCIWRLACREAGRWEKLYRVLELRPTWPKADLLRLRWVSPLEIYPAGNGQKKIVFATEEGVLAYDLDGSGDPEMLISPEEGTGDSSDGTTIAARTVGLVEESLVFIDRPSEEIIFSSPWRKAWSEVLKWMPAQSVAALMCVCKEWKAVINSDRFVRAHALHANMGKSPQIRLVHPDWNRLQFYHPLESCEIKQQHEVMPFLFDHRGSRVVCSKPCHGLVLVSCTVKGDCFEYLCNPSLEYSRRIFLDKDINDDACNNSSLSAGRAGLGYDLRRNKHVLVRLLVCCQKSSPEYYQLECYIQHTNTTSWISIRPPPRIIVADMQPAYADGKLYWMVDPKLKTKSSAARCELLALDIGTREFQVLRGPPCKHDRITSIVEFQGSICILCSDRTANAIDVWELKAGFWSVEYRIELGEYQRMYSSDETTLLTIDPKDGRILVSTGQALGYYDPKTKALQTIYYLGEHLHGMKFAPALCHESLLRPQI